MAELNRLKRIMIVAGEASGDIYGAQLIGSLKSMSPGIEFVGLGGTEMQRAGARILYPLAGMSVVGVTEVIPSMRNILQALNGLKRELKTHPPDLLVLIDYPEFNLNLAKSACSLGISVFYYIPPQVWAWRRGRVKKIKKRTDRVAVVLPFEKQFYSSRGLDVEYVGHPIIDTQAPQREDNETRKDLGIGHSESPIVCLLPGSRAKEVDMHFPVMVDAAGIIASHYPDICCIVPLASTVSEDSLKPYITGVKFPVKPVRAPTRELLKISDLALVASGTATLEAAMTVTPMVIIYKVSFVSYLLAKLMVSTPNIGLVNLVAGRQIVPELIQGDAEPWRLSQEGLKILKNNGLRSEMRGQLRMAKEKLGPGGASGKAASLAMEMIGS